MGVQCEVKPRACTRLGQLIQFRDELERPDIVARDFYRWIMHAKRLNSNGERKEIGNQLATKCQTLTSSTSSLLNGTTPSKDHPAAAAASRSRRATSTS